MTEDEKWVELHRLMREEGYHTLLRVGDEEYVALHRLMFHWTIRRGTIERVFEYDDAWCYTADFDSALSHLLDWKSLEFSGEPQGWVRHPRTGRRRPNGDASREYVNW